MVSTTGAGEGATVLVGTTAFSAGVVEITVETSVV